MANKNLFEQAIIDAKAIREAAIANAKLALEDNLTEGVKEMLAEKLKALEEEVVEEEVDMEEADTMEEGMDEKDMEETVSEGEDDSMEEEVVAEAEEEEVEAEEEPAEEEDMEDDSEEVEDDMEDSEEVESEVEDMSIEDLKDLIRDILAQEMGEEGEDEADMEVDLDAPVDGMEGEVDMEGGEEEEVDLEELLSELTEGEDKVEEEMDEVINDPSHESATAHGNVAEEEMEEGEMNELSPAYTKVLQATNQIMDTLDVSQDTAMMLVGAAGIAGVVGASAIVSWVNQNGERILSRIKGMLPGKEGEEKVSEELDEALATIEALQEDLNETNLLNAKLLYLNKIFKSNNLTESQKANTIASFDKAETVKEVKLVFETVSENLTVNSTKKPVNEVKGMASKAAGVAPKKPEIISEGNEVVNRMQFLAGIIKK